MGDSKIQNYCSVIWNLKHCQFKVSLVCALIVNDDKMFACYIFQLRCRFEPIKFIRISFYAVT